MEQPYRRRVSASPLVQATCEIRYARGPIPDGRWGVTASPGRPSTLDEIPRNSPMGQRVGRVRINKRTWASPSRPSTGSHCAENHACNVALAHLPPQQQPDQVTERYGKITNGSFLAAQTRARLNRWNVPARGGAAQPLLIWRRWLSQGDGPLSGLLIASCASALFPVGASGAIDGLARGGDSGLANLVGRVPRVPRALRPCSHSHIACEAGPVRQKISQLWRR